MTALFPGASPAWQEPPLLNIQLDCKRLPIANDKRPSLFWSEWKCLNKFYLESDEKRFYNFLTRKAFSGPGNFDYRDRDRQPNSESFFFGWSKMIQMFFGRNLQPFTNLLTIVLKAGVSKLQPPNIKRTISIVIRHQLPNNLK